MLWLPTTALQHEQEAVVWPHEAAEWRLLPCGTSLCREPLREVLDPLYEAVLERLSLH